MLGKQVYSLVLMDDVVREVDKAAYHAGMSRSAMINQVLAEYVRFPTPRQMSETVLGELARLLGDPFQVTERSSGGMALRSALRYKYNPTVRYQLLLTPDDARCAGLLRVSLRTQYQPLLDELARFFAAYCRLERRYQPNPRLSDEGVASMDNGRLVRRLYPASRDAGRQAEAISAYVGRLDGLLKEWFNGDTGYSLEDSFRRTLAHIPSI